MRGRLVLALPSRDACSDGNERDRWPRHEEPRGLSHHPYRPIVRFDGELWARRVSRLEYSPKRPVGGVRERVVAGRKRTEGEWLPCAVGRGGSELGRGCPRRFGVDSARTVLDRCAGRCRPPGPVPTDIGRRRPTAPVLIGVDRAGRADRCWWSLAATDRLTGSDAGPPVWCGARRTPDRADRYRTAPGVRKTPEAPAPCLARRGAACVAARPVHGGGGPESGWGGLAGSGRNGGNVRGSGPNPATARRQPGSGLAGGGADRAGGPVGRCRPVPDAAGERGACGGHEPGRAVEEDEEETGTVEKSHEVSRRDEKRDRRGSLRRRSRTATLASGRLRCGPDSAESGVRCPGGELTVGVSARRRRRAGGPWTVGPWTAGPGEPGGLGGHRSYRRTEAV